MKTKKVPDMEPMFKNGQLLKKKKVQLSSSLLSVVFSYLLMQESFLQHPLQVGPGSWLIIHLPGGRKLST